MRDDPFVIRVIGYGVAAKTTGKTMDRRDVLLAGLAPADGGAHTPVQVQKLFFLLDENIAADLGGKAFDFTPYDYGPFDANVYRGLERLLGEGLVTIDFDGSSRTRCYRLTSEGQRSASEALNRLSPRARDYITRASKFVRTLPFADLVAAIYKAYPSMKANSVFRD